MNQPKPQTTADAPVRIRDRLAEIAVRAIRAHNDPQMQDDLRWLLAQNELLVAKLKKAGLVKGQHVAQIRALERSRLNAEFIATVMLVQAGVQSEETVTETLKRLRNQHAAIAERAVKAGGVRINVKMTDDGAMLDPQEPGTAEGGTNNNA